MNRKSFLKISALSILSLYCKSLLTKKEIVKTKSPQKVLVIGAGMAGASAAFHLKEIGHEVQVIEARNRIGGRIWTDRSEGYPIDLGAAWIHGANNNPLVDLAEMFSTKTKETDFSSILLMNESKKVSKSDLFFAYYKFESIQDDIKSISKDVSTDFTVKELLLKEYSKYNLTPLERNIFSFLERGIENENASDLNATSANALFHTSENYKGEDELVYGGYDTIISGLLSKIPIVLGEKVQHIKSQSSGIIVETSKKSYSADFVIVTVPVSILKKQSIRFSPNLPMEKLAAIQDIPMGVFNKYVLEFDEKFWSDEEVFANISEPNPFYDLIFNLHNYIEKPILGFLIAGNKSIKFEKDTDIKNKAILELSNIFQKKIPEPKRIISTKWGSDEFSLGSYSYAVKNMKNLIKEYAKPFGKIHFAGEATHEKYFSYVHGAYLSGKREAELIQLKINS